MFSPRRARRPAFARTVFAAAVRVAAASAGGGGAFGNRRATNVMIPETRAPSGPARR
jgi:hypothetical protein